MANLGTTLRAIDGVRTVVLEAPRESETIRPQSLPHIWCWEGPEGPPVNSGTGMLKCELPINVEIVFRHDDRTPLRSEGRKWIARIQQALAADVGRGIDASVNAAHAVDTSEQGNAIAETPTDGFGVAHLDYLITYNRARNNPYGLTPVAA